jgi:GNAT superfamily N-acetyltransferase
LFHRDAKLADLPSLNRIHIAAWRAAYQGLMDPDFLASMGSAHSEVRLRPAIEAQPPRVLVIESEQGILGFSRHGPSRDGETTQSVAEVFAFNVDPDHWRKGIGSQLMHATLDRLWSLGFGCCVLWVLDKNYRARRFYEAVGFELSDATRTEAANTKYPLLEVSYTLRLSSTKSASE